MIERQVRISAARAQAGDKVVLSGAIGDHGVTIMIARGELVWSPRSRAILRRSTNSLVEDMLAEVVRHDAPNAIHCLRDPTRGGVATTLNEIALSSEVCVQIIAESLVMRMRANPYGRDACIVGEVKNEPPGIVAMVTGFGGTRIVDMLVGEQLPRIC